MLFSVGSPNGQTNFDCSDLENPMGERSRTRIPINREINPAMVRRVIRL